MARPKKSGLRYFPKDVDYYEDFKIIDLINEYGPLGNTIFDCILCMIYREGYYIAIAPDKLAFMVMKAIGNKWVKNKTLVLQVIRYCADIGLFDKDLLNQNVITSTGVQKRYAEATVRNKANKSLYWLIDENGQSLKNATKNRVNVTETRVNVTETSVNDVNIPQSKVKQSKVKKSIETSACAPTPTLSEVLDFCKDKRIDGERFYNYYDAVNWVTGVGVPVRNWKSLALNWEKTEKVKPITPEPSYDIGDFDKRNVFDIKGD